MANVLVLPGIGGSGLAIQDAPYFGIKAWGNSKLSIGLRVAFQTLDDMHLDDQGKSIKNVTPDGVFDIYDELINNLNKFAAAGDTISAYPYDWRLGPIELGEQLADSLGNPTYFVAHSNAGIVVSQCYRHLVEKQRPGLFAGAIFLGCPVGLDNSNYSMLQCFDETGDTYGGLWYAAGFGRLIGAVLIPANPFSLGTNINPADSLDQAIATWTGTYANLPARDEFTAAYMKSHFRNKHVTDSGLNRGRAEFRESLSEPQIPPYLLYQIYGTNYNTPNNWIQGDGYKFTTVGDGAVAVAESLYEGNRLVLTSSHQGLPTGIDIAQLIMAIIDGGAFLGRSVDVSGLNNNGYRYNVNSINLGDKREQTTIPLWVNPIINHPDP